MNENILSCKEINAILKRMNLKADFDADFDLPNVFVSHRHCWDHSYESYECDHSCENPSGDDDTLYYGTRRRFYRDLETICDFTQEYLLSKKCESMIVAPCVHYGHFEYGCAKNDIYYEVRSFFAPYRIRSNSRAGVVVPNGDRKAIEMVLEGAFRAVTDLCLLLPEAQILIVPYHHCGYSVYSAVSPSEELDRIRKIISKYAGEMLCHLCSNARTAAETVVQ